MLAQVYTLALTAVMLNCTVVRAQFPRMCATLEAILSHECCPPMNGSGSQCGFTEGRGQCESIVVDGLPHGNQYVLVGIDDRERWPERFFNRSCVCNDNYGGFDCSRCKFGWQGDNCQERRPLAVRKNLLNMTEEEQSNFLDILDQSKTAPHPDYVIAQDHYRNLLGENGTEPQFVDISIYDFFVWLHYYSVRDTLLGPGQAYTAIDFSHEGPAFLTWHRMHLLQLEFDLQRLSGDSTFAIPFWNFATGGQECDICTDELLGARSTTDPVLLSANSRFADWNVVCLSLDWFNDNVKLCNGTDEGPLRRNPGGNIERPSVQKLPEPEDVENCVQVRSYDTMPFFSNSEGSFRNTLEGYSEPNGEFEEGVRTLHNLAHLFLNGTGGQTHASANDPLFVLLHSFTDAIFDEWMKRTNATVAEYPVENAPIGHNLDFNMVPFFPPVRNREMFVPSEQLGYSYAVEFPGVDSLTSEPSFVWAIVAVAAFAVFVVMVVALVNLVKQFRKKRRKESLYQSIIEDDADKGIRYTA